MKNSKKATSRNILKDLVCQNSEVPICISGPPVFTAHQANDVENNPRISHEYRRRYVREMRFRTSLDSSAKIEEDTEYSIPIVSIHMVHSFVKGYKFPYSLCCPILPNFLINRFSHNLKVMRRFRAEYISGVHICFFSTYQITTYSYD